jgi:HAD superfamily hydrolase (TIGR01509 family)
VSRGRTVAIDAVIFDMDGVLVDSEPTWGEVRRRFAHDHGGRWPDGAAEAMQGMATAEWARYMHDDLGVGLPPDQIAAQVIGLMADTYGERPPLLPGAVDAVRRLAARWPLGLASSSPTRLIAHVLDAAGLADAFRVTLSTEEVGPGKPAPDVYLTVAERLGVAPPRCAAIEDSTNGLRAALAAGMRVIAVPTASYPPDPEVLGRAAAVLPSLDALLPDVVDPDEPAALP